MKKRILEECEIPTNTEQTFNIKDLIENDKFLIEKEQNNNDDDDDKKDDDDNDDNNNIINKLYRYESDFDENANIIIHFCKKLSIKI